MVITFLSPCKSFYYHFFCFLPFSILEMQTRYSSRRKVEWNPQQRSTAKANKNFSSILSKKIYPRRRRKKFINFNKSFSLRHQRFQLETKLDKHLQFDFCYNLISLAYSRNYLWLCTVVSSCQGLTYSNIRNCMADR